MLDMPTQEGSPSPDAMPSLDGDASSYAVKLPIFEGPLDLLLHLIRVNEVEITDIPIARVGEQYLEFLEIMDELNVDIAAEYLLMAATLAWIKSRMLLPTEGDEDDEEGGDPRAELVARLLEYQRFKEVADGLGERLRLGRDVFEARLPQPDAPSLDTREVEVGIFELLTALRDVLKSTPHSGAAHSVEAESVTIGERMAVLLELLDVSESVEFSHVFRDPNGGRVTRELVVTTFLAMLELARIGAVSIYQGVTEEGVPSGPIRLRRAASRDDPEVADELARLT